MYLLPKRDPGFNEYQQHIKAKENDYTRDMVGLLLTLWASNCYKPE